MKRNFYVTPSNIFSQHLRNTVAVIGSDWTMFSVDYPCQFVPGAQDFLISAALPMENRAEVAHGNEGRLTGGIETWKRATSRCPNADDANPRAAVLQHANRTAGVMVFLDGDMALYPEVRDIG